MAKKNGRVVPVAYVTKWAGPIRVYCSHTTYNDKYLRLGGGRLASPSEWTEDWVVAEGRYQKTLRRRVDEARKELAASEAALVAAPVFREA